MRRPLSRRMLPFASSSFARGTLRARLSTPWAKALALVALAGGLLIAGFGPAVSSAVAASTPMVNLGQASTYAVLSGASVGNTVSAPGAPHTTLRGDLGVKPITAATGFPPGVVMGTINVGNSAAAAAHADLVKAYDEVAARTGGAPLAGALAGATISPGLYTIAGAVSNTGTVTLDAGGDPNAVFVFQVNGAMALAAGSHVVLANGAQASRVFWQVNGAGAVGANADFAGTLMALDAVAVGNSSVVNGRAFARNGALTLDDNEFYSVPPAVTIAGGATAITNNPTPTISGTTNAVAPGVVTVTIAGQTLTATPSGGAWSVTSASLANGSYAVVSSVTDGAGNIGSATQQLTVDTVLPVVTLAGGRSVTTNNPTPTISGTTNVAPGTVIRVTVDSQKLTALVQSAGAWNVRPTTLADGQRTITATVTDPAGNQGTANQVLTVDTDPPAATISGGAWKLTNEETPVISGTAGVAVGTAVTVTVAGQTLTGVVHLAGAWSVTAAALPDGPNRIIMSVSDAAGNRARITQILTVDTVPPVMTITGGANAATYNLDPTITGTSNAAPGTTVTISIAGQTIKTLVQTNHTWNATPTFVGEGTWWVAASSPDPAGNVGSATQTLTITHPLTLTAFTPASGPTGTRVTITGGFRSTTTVSFNGVAAVVLSRTLPSRLVVVVPAGATTGKITVSNTSAPIATLTSASFYTVTPHLPPSISSLTPASGITGSSVTITGTFLSGASSVKFGTLAAAYRIISASQINATVPTGASAGKISVTTAVATATSSAVFMPTLSITSFTPASGPTGTQATITGVGFTSTSTVKFNGITALSHTASSTQVVAVVPASATSGPVTVTNTGAPVGTVTSARAYIVTALPTITSFTPASGITGSTVAITGTSFSGATSVKLGTLAAPYQVVSATLIRATVPNGARPGTISVTTPVALATSSAVFTPTLSLTSFTPAGGPASSSVTITGVGFTSTSTVKFNGTAATVVSHTPSRLVATVPASATTGKITVTNTTTPAGTVSTATNYTKTP